jgi:metal-responsive CopG/Arc/MetJ family transcriptional regulator
MRANITIPNAVARAAERLADRLGVSLSEVYTAALTSYVTMHQDDVTAILNQVYSTESSELEPELVKVQLKSLDGEQW